MLDTRNQKPGSVIPAWYTSNVIDTQKPWCTKSRKNCTRYSWRYLFVDADHTKARSRCLSLCLLIKSTLDELIKLFDAGVGTHTLLWSGGDGLFDYSYFSSRKVSNFRVLFQLIFRIKGSLLQRGLVTRATANPSYRTLWLWCDIWTFRKLHENIMSL